MNSEMINIDKQISKLKDEFLSSRELEYEKRNLLTDMYNKLLDKDTSTEVIQKILETIDELLTNPDIKMNDKYMITINLLMDVIFPTFEQYTNEKTTDPEAQLNTELINDISDTYIDIIQKFSTEDGNESLIEILSYSLIDIIMYLKNDNLELQNKILENINNLSKSPIYGNNGILYLNEIEDRTVNEDIKNLAKNMLKDYE